MLASVTHILPLAKIRRARLLPTEGNVLVREGQTVGPADVIAQSKIDPRHVLVDICRELDILRTSEIERLFEVKVGDRLTKGDVIARVPGLFARYVRAPYDSQIIMMANGRVLLELSGKQFDLVAGLPGTVMEVIPERGVILETDGAIVQGTWGNGKIDLGLLLLLLKTPDGELTREQIDVSMRGAVILAGHCGRADVLRATSDLSLRGLILSSMSADLIPTALSLPFPVVVIEGFGKIPLSPPAFKLLSGSEKRDVSVNGVARDAFTGDRPEVIIPLPSEGKAPAEVLYFQPNQTVRVQGAPYTGRVGRLVQVRPGVSRLPGGLRTRVAEVLLDNVESVVIPLANLEVIE
jgi:hypothetical protein